MSKITVRPIRAIYVWTILAILMFQFGLPEFLLGLALNIDLELK